MSEPLVSVVIPSLNHARFLREAIDSVLVQDYPRIELIVMDGGSTDGSVQILESYGDRIAYVSECDGGQAAALERGFGAAQGEIFAWLNSDDRYCPGAIATGVQALLREPRATLAYGEGELIDDRGEVLGPFPWTQDFDLWRLVHVLDYILQPTVFVRADAWRAVGGLDATLRYGLDWDLWIRLARHGQAVRMREVIAQAREHGETKTATGGWTRLRELRAVMTRHGAGPWSPGVVVHGLDTLRKLWPTVFGASSVADERGGIASRLCWPIHLVVSRCIRSALASSP